MTTPLSVKILARKTTLPELWQNLAPTHGNPSVLDSQAVGAIASTAVLLTEYIKKKHTPYGELHPTC